MKRDINNHMQPVIRLFLVSAILLVITMAFADVIDGQAEDARYTLIRNRWHHERIEDLPYPTISTMQWNDTDGFYEVPDERGYTIAIVVDWHEEVTGTITMLSDGRCYIMMFSGFFGDDNHPHPVVYEWIKCTDD